MTFDSICQRELAMLLEVKNSCLEGLDTTLRTFVGRIAVIKSSSLMRDSWENTTKRSLRNEALSYVSVMIKSHERAMDTFDEEYAKHEAGIRTLILSKVALATLEARITVNKERPEVLTKLVRRIEQHKASVEAFKGLEKRFELHVQDLSTFVDDTQIDIDKIHITHQVKALKKFKTRTKLKVSTLFSKRGT